MVFGAAALAVNAFVEPPGVAVGERGDDEGATKQGFCAGVSGPSAPASTGAMMRSVLLQFFGAIFGLIETAGFSVVWRGLVTGLDAFSSASTRRFNGMVGARRRI